MGDGIGRQAEPGPVSPRMEKSSLRKLAPGAGPLYIGPWKQGIDPCQ